MSSTEIVDVVVIGGGIAGYTAAIYAARAGLTTMVFEGESWGGQLMTTDLVENYPGFPDGIDGPQLVENMREQAEKCGARLSSKTVSGVTFASECNEVRTPEEAVKCLAVIIATGATAKTIEFDSYDLDGDKTSSFWNRGISACAVCDGALPRYRNKHILVVGGGDSACQEALFLSRFASKVTVLVRSDKMRASSVMQKRVRTHAKILVKFNSQIESVYGDSKGLVGAVIDSERVDASGIFFAIGHTPNTSFLNNALTLDDNGYIETSDGTHTSSPGVFACGDVQDSKYRQAITAAGSGCQAALDSEHYIISKSSCVR